MTSKNLYSKLMKEDLKSRLWAISLIALGCFFLYPVTVEFESGTINSYANYELGLLKYSERIIKWLSFNNGVSAFLIMLVAMICGLSGFSHLNSRSKVDFYHSIPVKREKLYIANYLNGILILALPYAICMALAVCVGISNGIDGMQLWKTALEAYVLSMVYFMLAYTSVVIAVIMTGNLVVAFLGSLVFNFYIPIMTGLIQGYFGIFYKTYVWSSNAEIIERMVRTSPVMEYTYQISRYSDGESVWMAALAALVVSAALAVLGGALYRKRPSEAAGKAMAFAVTKPVIRILITMMCAMGLGGFFWSMRHSTGWAVFGVLCGAVISHCVIEIIYHFDFKKLFANKGQLIACTLASIAILFVFRYDLTGYDKYMPAESKVEKSAILIRRFNNWTSYGEVENKPNGAYGWKSISSMNYVVDNMNYTDTANLLSIAAAGIDETVKDTEQEAGLYQYSRRYEPSQMFDETEPQFFSEVTICYTLKGGRHVYRRYSLNIDNVMPQIEKLYGSAEYQQGTFPLMSKNAENIAEIYYSEQRKDIRLQGLTQEDKKAILDTYRREFAAMTPESMKKEYPVGLIRFTTEMDEAALQWREQERLNRKNYYDSYGYSDDILSDREFYPVYPSNTETIKLLKDRQVDVGTYFEKMDISSVRVGWDKILDESGVVEPREILITDPDEIAQLKRILMGPGLQYYSPLYEVSELHVNFMADENGTTNTYRAYFPRGQVPDFVTSRLVGEN